MGMRAFVVRRVGQLILTFGVFITLLFFGVRLMPGDPTTLYVAEGMPPAQQQAVIERLGLDRPLHIQYIEYIQSVLQGDFGYSFYYQQAVSSILTIKIANTLFLMLGGYTLALTGGILFGAILAWWRDTTFERYGIIIPFILRSMPSFWIGILLILVFGLYLDWLPVGGFSSVGTIFDSFWDRYLRWDFLYYVALPMLTAAIYYSAVPMLLMRNTMLEILNSDFIRMKDAEGLSQFDILYKHAVRNSLLPIITVAAVIAGRSVGGAVLIEVVFNWPGMGRAMVDAVYANDYPLAIAAFFVMGVLIMIMNFVADILYASLDPRVTYE
jgi:peptide/nickel transport system permease protein